MQPMSPFCFAPGTVVRWFQLCAPVLPKSGFHSQKRRSGTMRLYERNPETSALISVLSSSASSDFYFLSTGDSATSPQTAKQHTAASRWNDQAKKRLWLAFAGTLLLSGAAAMLLMTHSHVPASDTSVTPAVVSISERSEATEQKSPDTPIASEQAPAAVDLSLPPAPRIPAQSQVKHRLDRKPEPPKSASSSAPRTLKAAAVRNIHLPMPAIQATNRITAPPSEISQTLAQPPVDALPILLVPPAPPVTAPGHAKFGPLETAASIGQVSGYLPPQPLKSSAPHAPASALAALRAPVTIEVQVDIDKSGHVTQARASTPEKQAVLWSKPLARLLASGCSNPLLSMGIRWPAITACPFSFDRSQQNTNQVRTFPARAHHLSGALSRQLPAQSARTAWTARSFCYESLSLERHRS